MILFLDENIAELTYEFIVRQTYLDRIITGSHVAVINLYIVARMSISAFTFFS